LICSFLETEDIRRAATKQNQTMLNFFGVVRIWDRCYDFKNIIAEKFGAKILAFSAQTAATFC
jgi:hypothetical protein